MRSSVEALLRRQQRLPDRSDFAMPEDEGSDGGDNDDEAGLLPAGEDDMFQLDDSSQGSEGGSAEVSASPSHLPFLVRDLHLLIAACCLMELAVKPSWPALPAARLGQRRGELRAQRQRR